MTSRSSLANVFWPGLCWRSFGYWPIACWGSPTIEPPPRILSHRGEHNVRLLTSRPRGEGYAQEEGEGEAQAEGFHRPWIQAGSVRESRSQECRRLRIRPSRGGQEEGAEAEVERRQEGKTDLQQVPKRWTEGGAMRHGDVDGRCHRRGLPVEIRAPALAAVRILSHVYGGSRHRCLARFLAAFRRRSFFFRHFHRCFPCFFQAREPLFIR